MRLLILLVKNSMRLVVFLVKISFQFCYAWLFWMCHSFFFFVIFYSLESMNGFFVWLLAFFSDWCTKKWLHQFGALLNSWHSWHLNVHIKKRIINCFIWLNEKFGVFWALKKKKSVFRILSSFNINFQQIRNFSKFLEEVFKKVRITLRPRLGGGNEMEWKEMKIIILEYYSFSLFGSFNEGNGKFIPLFGSLKWEGTKWVEGNTRSSLFP